MFDFEKLTEKFFAYAEAKNIEIYNEFSFQHELGIFLREELKNYCVQFERNISYFQINSKLIKKEIDISIFNGNKSEKYAIELKHPVNGQYPEQMYKFVKDLKFMEELRDNGFTKTAVIVLVSDRLFYEGENIQGIYKYFREEHRVYGNISKPTGTDKGKESISLSGTYDFSWKPAINNMKYFVIEI